MDLLLLGKEPISAEQPTGSDIRYDPVFEELQAEVDKLSSPVAIGTIDWEKVVKLASDILARKSKDLLVASYLAVALIYTRQIDGLAIGMKVYSDLFDQFWDNLYPPKMRMRGRAGAIVWWLEKAETALKQLKEKTFPGEQINLLRENLKKIDQFLNQNIEETPSLGPLYDILNSFEQAQPEMTTQAPAKETRGAASSEPAKKAHETGVEIAEQISSQRDAQRVLSHAFKKMSDAAFFFWQQDLSNPLVYRLNRIAAWVTVEELPPSTEGRTKIPPPPAQLKDTLYNFKNKGDAEILLRSAEEKLSQFIFWLDINLFVSDTMSILGTQYQRAQDAVCQETGFFIYRFPDLVDLSFSDGTPFASPETKQWLKGIVLKPGTLAEDSVAAQEPLSTAQDEDQINKEIEEAEKLIKKGKLLEAIERVQQHLRNSFSQRDKMLWRLALSQLLMNVRQTKLALPYLEQILKDIDNYRLDEYDCMIALRGLKLVWLGLNSQSDDTSRAKAHDTLSRIAKLDLTEVIRLGKNK